MILLAQIITPLFNFDYKGKTGKFFARFLDQ